MWYDNLPRLRAKLSQVTFPYKVVINLILILNLTLILILILILKQNV